MIELEKEWNNSTPLNPLPSMALPKHKTSDAFIFF